MFNLTWNQVADKMPEIAEAGYTALWLPPPTKANSQFSAGYDIFDAFDLGNIDQKGSIATRYGTKDELVRMVQIAHRFGSGVIPATAATTSYLDAPVAGPRKFYKVQLIVPP